MDDTRFLLLAGKHNSMLKLLVGIVGLLELLYPERVVRVFTNYAYDYEGEAPVAKQWLVNAARIEGVVLVGAVVVSALKADCSCGLLCGSNEDEDDPAADLSDNTSVDRVD